ncbi:MAG: DUF4293 family protein [Balneolaceae bacterium]
MIQRIQSLYLLGATIVNVALFFSPLYRHAMRDPAGWIGISFAVLLVAAGGLALFSIFLYSDRVRQLRWVRIGSLIQVAILAFSAAILFTLGGFGSFLIRELITTGLVLLALLLYLLATRSIRKDEELVRSMDRIR